MYLDTFFSLELFQSVLCRVVEVEMNVGLHGSSLSELGLVTSDVNLNLIIPGCDMHKVSNVTIWWCIQCVLSSFHFLVGWNII